MSKPLSFQSMILALQHYWGSQGCVILPEDGSKLGFCDNELSCSEEMDTTKQDKEIAKIRMETIISTSESGFSQLFSPDNLVEDQKS